jgi:hypothetical protein
MGLSRLEVATGNSILILRGRVGAAPRVAGYETGEGSVIDLLCPPLKIAVPMKTLVKKVLKRFGFERRGAVGAEFVLYRYLKPDGSFDYEKYRAIQERGNKEKIDWVWVVEENIAFLADYIQKHLQGVQFGICHGTRRGKEQEWFRKYLGCEVIGTELSETATSFPNTIQWDFHKVKPEWLNSVDFIYSNSFDHSYDPEQCLNTWMSCLKKGGFCILEHTSFHTAAATSELDPSAPISC